VIIRKIRAGMDEKFSPGGWSGMAMSGRFPRREKACDALSEGFPAGYFVPRPLLKLSPMGDSVPQLKLRFSPMGDFAPQLKLRLSPVGDFAPRIKLRLSPARYFVPQPKLRFSPRGGSPAEWVLRLWDGSGRQTADARRPADAVREEEIKCISLRKFDIIADICTAK
jgi:hypothetical protein